MWKVDSFLAETQHFEGVLTSSMQRKATKDLTLSDGPFVSMGAHLSVPTIVFYRDNAAYGNPGVFNAFSTPKRVTMDVQVPDIKWLRTTLPRDMESMHALGGSRQLILMSYNVKFGDSISRPSSMHWDLGVIADPLLGLCFGREPATDGI